MKKTFHITKFSELGLSRTAPTAPTAPTTPTPVEETRGDMIAKALIILTGMINNPDERAKLRAKKYETSIKNAVTTGDLDRAHTIASYIVNYSNCHQSKSKDEEGEVKQPIKQPIDKKDQQQKINKGEVKQNVSYIRQLKKKANERNLARHLKKRI
jgi:hypothetical protein